MSSELNVIYQTCSVLSWVAVKTERFHHQAYSSRQCCSRTWQATNKGRDRWVKPISLITTHKLKDQVNEQLGSQSSKLEKLETENKALSQFLSEVEAVRNRYMRELDELKESLQHAESADKTNSDLPNISPLMTSRCSTGIYKCWTENPLCFLLITRTLIWTLTNPCRSSPSNSVSSVTSSRTHSYGS